MKQLTKKNIIKLLEEEYYETEEQIQGGFTPEMIKIIEKEYGKTNIADIYEMIDELVAKELKK